MGFDQGAVEEVDGKDISPSTVSTEERNLTARLREQAVASDADTDDTTALSLDLTGLSNPRAYTLILEIAGAGGGVVDLKIQADNDTGTNYDYVTLNTTTLTEKSGETAWTATVVGDRQYTLIFDLGNPRTASGGNVPTIGQRNHTHNLDRVMQGEKSGGPFSSVQISTSGGTSPNAVGEAVIVESEIL